MGEFVYSMKQDYYALPRSIIYFIVGVVVFFSNDSLSKNILGDNADLYIQFFYVLLIGFLLIKYKHHRTFSGKLSIRIWAILIILIYAVMFFNVDVSLGYTVQVLSLTTGFIITRKIFFHDFVSAYNQIIYSVSFLSIVLFFTFLLFPSVQGLFPVSQNRVENEYINLFFYVHFVDLYRNTGIFREPGVFMIFLNLAILFEIFFFNKPRKRRLAIFLISLLTTLSTAGFIIFLIIALVYLLRARSVRNYLGIGVVAGVLVFFIISNYEIFETTFNKFDPSSPSYVSAVSRVGSAIIPINIFSDFPYFGVGLAKFFTLYESYSYSLFGFRMPSGGHATNTILNALATYGLIYFVLIFFGFYFLTKNFTSSFTLRLLILLSIILMLSNQDIRYSLIFSTLLFYGYSKNIC